MFKYIQNIADVQPFVAEKKEIRFNEQPNGITVGCYIFMDSKTFDSAEALECRGIAFDKAGNIVSRPLHKFFNVGEKDWLSPNKLLARSDIVGIYEKVDGSMIATAYVDGVLQWRSKKAFNSDVVNLTHKFLAEEKNKNIADFAEMIAKYGYTAIFELTHPDARIVVESEWANLQLLHVRHNNTGEYVLLDPTHIIHDWIEYYKIPCVMNYIGLSFADALASLENMREQEGYVIQFANGDMAKVKSPWYLRLHRSITFLRERNIATLALHEELDDVKGALAEAGIDLAAVEDVEARLKNILLAAMNQIEEIYEAGKSLDRKDFAIANKSNPLFSLAMNRYLGRDIGLTEWYEKNRLKEDFSLKVLMNEAQAEELE